MIIQNAVKLARRMKADNMDAKMEIFKEAVAASTGDDWIGWQGMLDSNIRRTTLS